MNLNYFNLKIALGNNVLKSYHRATIQRDILQFQLLINSKNYYHLNKSKRMAFYILMAVGKYVLGKVPIFLYERSKY